MRTSDKILLGTFVAGIALLTSMNLVLYAKYKRGDIVAVNKPENLGPSFRHVRQVVIKGQGNINIYPSDSLRLVNWKTAESHFRFKLQDSTLTIFAEPLYIRSEDHGASSTIQENLTNYGQADLYLGPVAKISAEGSWITLHGTSDSLKARSYSFDLRGSNLNIGVLYEPDTSYWKAIHVRAMYSHIKCMTKGKIDFLAATLDSSSLADDNFPIGGGRVEMDTSSTIELHGRNIYAIKTSLK